MHPSRVSTGGTLVILVAGLALAGCTATTSPSAAQNVSSPSTTPSASTGPSASIAPIATVAPSASVSSAPSPTPDSTPEPTVAEPTPTPSAPPVTSDAVCGIGRTGFFADRDEVPREFHFGGATIEFRTAGIGLRNGTYDADDAIPAGIGLTPDELAVRVDPGTHIILRATGATLTSLDVRVVPWSTVSFEGGLGASSAAPVDLVWRLRADGSISVSAPLTSGDYMVDFHPLWQTTCLRGDGSAYSRIKVN